MFHRLFTFHCLCASSLTHSFTISISPHPSYIPHHPSPHVSLSVHKEDRRHSFHRLAVVCHDVIRVATRQTVSRYAQMHQAPDPNPNTHTHTRGLSPALNHLRPLTLSQTIMPGLRSLTYFCTHTHCSSFLCVLIPFILSPFTAIHNLCVHFVHVSEFMWHLYVRGCDSMSFCRCVCAYKGRLQVYLSVCECSQVACVFKALFFACSASAYVCAYV